MNEYAVQLVRSARKELENLNIKLQDRLLAAISILAENPRPAGCKKLKGETGSFRIRVGHYRVVYEISGNIVVIIRIRHRKDAYQ